MKNKRPKPESLAAFAARSLRSDGAAPEPRPRGEALQLAIADLIEQLGEDDLDDLESQEQGARLACAYRVARALGGAQHHIAFDDPIANVPAPAWHEHTAAYTQGPPDGPTWLRTIAEAKVGLVPTKETADAYGEVLWLIAARLGLGESLESKLGLLSLLNSLEEGDVTTWPTPEAIVELEQSLVLRALHLATVSPAEDDEDGDHTPASTAKAERVLREDYGLTEPEVQAVMALARARALELLPSGEAGRAMTWASLEDGVRRSQAALDLRSELSFRKLQAMVLGLTRGEGPENQAAEFVEVVKRVAARQDADLLDAESHRLLNGRRRDENVEPVVLEPATEDDEFDADALADFDRENR